MDKLLNTAQVAKILGVVKLATVYRFIKEGKLKATKLGGNGKSRRHWRIKARDLEAFINGNTEKASAGQDTLSQVID